MKLGPGTKPRAGVGLTSVMVALTLTTGMIEAVSFLVLGPVFTAVQTGNLLFFSFALTGAVGLSPAAALVSFVGFTVGAVLGSRFESSVDAHGRRWFVAALIVEALLLGLGGLVAWRTGVDATGAPADAPHFAVVALVAGAMGVRNVTTLRARVADVPTTVSTRALTALLSGLPPHPDSRIGAGSGDEGRRLASVTAMFLGGLLGAWLLHEGVHPAVVLLVPAALVLTLGAAFWLKAPEGTSEPG
ncbi:YoaK family protein [Streptomyces europaeiscabiei]|uniref:YoaK family protein n=1 Tax=Streptomyces europaeiscabiei TaxID=146819 RepID=UPI001F098B62|nr:YoaK family protein [Streptomyces europaeiscabiei]MDX3834721.1 YoaK family protein [Streptomyces europaeiscabiei]